MKAASLFDIPISPEKRAWLLDALSQALAESNTDEQFARRLRHLAQQQNTQDEESNWSLAMRHLGRYHRGMEMGVSLRTLAQRLLANPPPPVTRIPLTLPDLQRNRIAGLIRPALFYVLVMVVLAALANIFIPNAFPDWSWTSNKPAGW